LNHLELAERPKKREAGALTGALRIPPDFRQGLN